jgi:hypothetical protein
MANYICRCRLVQGSNSEKERIRQALERVQITTAARIDRHFELKVNGTSCFGRPLKGNVHSISTLNSLKLYVEEDDTNSNLLSLDLADILAKFCNIEKNELHSKLLYVALSDKSLSEIQNAFQFDGINVTMDLKKGMAKFLAWQSIVNKF